MRSVSSVNWTTASSSRSAPGGLSDTEFVMGMAESIALGAGCLDDLSVNRADAAQAQLRGFEIPALQTAGAWLRRFTFGHILQLGKALLRAQRNAFVAAGVKRVTLDFDSTYVFSRSRRRQGVDRTYKKGYALHPLLCFDAHTGAAVHARLQRGRAGASTGISTFVAEALRAVPDGVEVRARFDSGFYSGPLFAQLEEAGVTYLCGAPLSAPIVEVASRIADEYWVSCGDDGAQVSEFGYRLRDGGPFRRYVVKRIQIPPGKQASLWEGGYRYWVFDRVTDAAVIEAEHRRRPWSRLAWPSSSPTSACTPFASTGSWPTGRGCSCSAWATTCAAGPSTSAPSAAAAETASCGPNGCATATCASRPCWCAAVGASRCGSPQAIPSSGDSWPRSTGSDGWRRPWPDPPHCRKRCANLVQPALSRPPAAAVAPTTPHRTPRAGAVLDDPAGTRDAPPQRLTLGLSVVLSS
ncbi:MAG: transposase [Actinomycetota bacterium]|nr:transposase [Actinomycetota bacterium]MDQ3573484.1 transposase [Actinomycetota bacterium]